MIIDYSSTDQRCQPLAQILVEHQLLRVNDRVLRVCMERIAGLRRAARDEYNRREMFHDNQRY